MKVIVGLGNPGANYAMTRHNVGFILADVLNQLWDGGEWQRQGAFEAECSRVQVAGKAVLLVKPQTYVNVSGRSVRKILSYYKVGLDDLAVLYDDLDQAALAVKAREGGGHGGHNGVRDIIEECGDDAFFRVKVGIGRPAEKARVSEWVLGPFEAHELEQLKGPVLDQVLMRLEPFLHR